jgi:hypothetical protein
MHGACSRQFKTLKERKISAEADVRIILKWT